MHQSGASDTVLVCNGICLRCSKRVCIVSLESCFEFSHGAYRFSYTAKALPVGYAFVGLEEISGHLIASVCSVCKKGRRVIVTYGREEVCVS